MKSRRWNWMLKRPNLVFNVAAIAPLVHLNMQVVGAWATNKRGDVEFTRVPGPLGVADLAMVHPHGERGVNALEAQSYLMIPILMAEIKRGHVTTTFIIINWHTRWIDGKGKVEVGVLGALPVALQLPHARDTDSLRTPAMTSCQGIRLVLVEVGGPF
jgi:hypothetical protein